MRTRISPLNAVKEVRELAIYIEGMATATDNEKLKCAAEWLEKLSGHVCREGYIGCCGGEGCTSDHK